MKRRSVLIVVVLFLLSVPFAVWMALPSDPINAANFARVQVGMTEREVEGILGAPAGSDIADEAISGKVTRVERMWPGSHSNFIAVEFEIKDKKALVCSKELIDSGRWDRLKSWWTRLIP